MTKKMLILWLKRRISELPKEFPALYDAATIDIGIQQCLKTGIRYGYEAILRLLTEEDRYKDE